MQDFTDDLHWWSEIVPYQIFDTRKDPQAIMIFHRHTSTRTYHVLTSDDMLSLHTAPQDMATVECYRGVCFTLLAIIGRVILHKDEGKCFACPLEGRHHIKQQLLYTIPNNLNEIRKKFVQELNARLIHRRQTWIGYICVCFCHWAGCPHSNQGAARHRVGHVSRAWRAVMKVGAKNRPLIIHPRLLVY